MTRFPGISQGFHSGNEYIAGRDKGHIGGAAYDLIHQSVNREAFSPPCGSCGESHEISESVSNIDLIICQDLS